MSLTSGSWSGRGWLGEALLQCGKTMEEDARLFLVQGAGGFSGPRDSGGLLGKGPWEARLEQGLAVGDGRWRWPVGRACQAERSCEKATGKGRSRLR